MGTCQSAMERGMHGGSIRSRSRSEHLPPTPPPRLTESEHRIQELGAFWDRNSEAPVRRPRLYGEIDPAPPTRLQSLLGTGPKPRPQVYVDRSRPSRIQEQMHREKTFQTQMHSSKYVSRVDSILDREPDELEPLARGITLVAKYKRADSARREWTTYQTACTVEKVRLEDLLQNGHLVAHTEDDRKLIKADCETIRKAQSKANEEVMIWTRRCKKIEETEVPDSVTTSRPKAAKKSWQKGYYDDPSNAESYIPPPVLQEVKEGAERDDLDYDGQDETGTVPGYIGYGTKSVIEQVKKPKVAVIVPPVPAPVAPLPKEKKEKKGGNKKVEIVMDPVIISTKTPSPLISPVSPDPSVEGGEASTSKLPVPPFERSETPSSDFGDDTGSVGGDRRTRNKGGAMANRGRPNKRGGRGGGNVG